MISFDHVKTRNRTQHKDELAKSIAERDGVTEASCAPLEAHALTAVSCFSRRWAPHGLTQKCRCGPRSAADKGRRGTLAG